MGTDSLLLLPCSFCVLAVDLFLCVACASALDLSFLLCIRARMFFSVLRV